ncbi:unnamed protein product [Rotaria sordida]|uniref:GRAM domain-containing protein n=1 Tax=Rotaria sordida TaxID=392033 RepID=A0A814CK01_9BILA|nr:unnamed protein product [Rotaria sordida]CAF0941262.1 unnamed protein product [Rotaria sordida]
MEMVNSRPESMIIQTESSGEINSNDTPIKRSSIKDEISSLSSIDSINDKTVNRNEKNSLLENNLATSSSTTDSDLESEQNDNLQSEEKKDNDKNRARVPKRVKYFRKFFESEIPDDMPEVIDCYVCAYYGDILLQGKMFITDRYLCFYSRIINYVTKHVYRWNEIDNITKERIAFIFPTAIGIKLKETKRKVIYASFLSRDDAYDKIVSIWSRFRNNINQSGEDESSSTPNGSLKSTYKNDKMKNTKRNSYESVNDSEPEEVLGMCLDENNANIQRVKSISPKIRDEKQKSTTLVNTYKDKVLEKNPILNQKLPNRLDGNSHNTNKSNRFSRHSKKEQKQDDATKRNNSLVTLQTRNTSLLGSENQIIDQTVSLQEPILSESNSSSALNPNMNSSITQINDNGIPTKIFNSTISFINSIIQTILSLFHDFHICPTKTTTFILLFLTVLFFHSFYLILLAYRVESRLQSLHNVWPSSVMKNSLQSNPNQL